ncbi:SDR family oxidoreductase [Patulibacter defluvii]|uniref:SDR family oxidoreductase n=1 Tax=Patulibacter defluvii TaxID=3095358 RepID=UPI002A76440C|nr:SDR family oxidoreductase [Patulibacter sp. DM4]
MPRHVLTGQLVAVTGGARGIGRATAAALLAAGARVAIGDLDAELATRTADELGGGRPDAIRAYPLDVTDRASFAAFLDAAERDLGPLFALVNNAGIMPIRAFADEDDATTDRIVDINLHGVLTGSKLALPRMRARGAGHLVNVASQAGRIGAAGLATYCATKFAVVGFCEALRIELHGSGIDVSCVMPAVVDTELTAGIEGAPRPLRIAPEDVAAAIVGTLRRPRPEVYVPRFLAPAYRAGGALPPRVRDRALRLVGSDHLMVDAADRAERIGYEARAAAPVQGHSQRDDATTAGDRR